jgi:hypothetical protein
MSGEPRNWGTNLSVRFEDRKKMVSSIYLTF